MEEGFSVAFLIFSQMSLIFPELGDSRNGPHEALDEPTDFRAQARSRRQARIFLLQRLAT